MRPVKMRSEAAPPAQAAIIIDKREAFDIADMIGIREHRPDILSRQFPLGAIGETLDALG